MTTWEQSIYSIVTFPGPKCQQPFNDYAKSAPEMRSYELSSSPTLCWIFSFTCTVDGAQRLSAISYTIAVD